MASSVVDVGHRQRRLRHPVFESLAASRAPAAPSSAPPEGLKDRQEHAPTPQPRPITRQRPSSPRLPRPGRHAQTPVPTGDSRSAQPAPRVPSEESHPSPSGCLQTRLATDSIPQPNNSSSNPRPRTPGRRRLVDEKRELRSRRTAADQRRGAGSPCWSESSVSPASRSRFLTDELPPKRRREPLFNASRRAASQCSL